MSSRRQLRAWRRWAGQKCRSQKIRGPGAYCPRSSRPRGSRRRAGSAGFGDQFFDAVRLQPCVRVQKKTKTGCGQTGRRCCCPRRNRGACRFELAWPSENLPDNGAHVTIKPSVESLSAKMVSIWPAIVWDLMDSKHLANHFLPLYFSTMTLATGCACVWPNRSILVSTFISFQSCPGRRQGSPAQARKSPRSRHAVYKLISEAKV
jgi:hypothetical protein